MHRGGVAGQPGIIHQGGSGRSACANGQQQRGGGSGTPRQRNQALGGGHSGRVLDQTAVAVAAALGSAINCVDSAPVKPDTPVSI